MDEIVETASEIGEHDVETVAGLREEPFFHLVGDRAGSADERKTAIAAYPLRELPHGQALALGQLHDPFASTLACIAFRNFRQGTVFIASCPSCNGAGSFAANTRVRRFGRISVCRAPRIASLQGRRSSLKPTETYSSPRFDSPWKRRFTL